MQRRRGRTTVNQLKAKAWEVFSSGFCEQIDLLETMPACLHQLHLDHLLSQTCRAMDRINGH
jgi:hypothetical protein